MNQGASILFMFMFNSDSSSLLPLKYINELENFNRSEKCIRTVKKNINLEECYFKYSVYDNSKYIILDKQNVLILMEKTIKTPFLRHKFFQKLKEEAGYKKVIEEKTEKKITSIKYYIESNNIYNIKKDNIIEIDENNNNGKISIKYYRKK